jgi:hypothetical protein
MVPPRPSVSPLYSFCVVPVRPTPPLAETLRSIIAWLRGARPSYRQQIRDAQMVELLAEELEVAAKLAGAGRKPVAKAKRGKI